MNRIILVGNGFDKALGLKTSYSEFIDWLVFDALKHTLLKRPDIKRETDAYSSNNHLFKVTTNKITSQHLEDKIDSYNGIGFLEELRKSFRFSNNLYLLSIKPAHPFMDELEKFYGKNKWVDIEQLYFDFLLSCTNENIKKFNQYFEFIKEKLKEYLKSIKLKHLNAYVLDKYRRHFFGDILEYNQSMKYFEESQERPNWFYFVNFNYTLSLMTLLDNAPFNVRDSITINPIHGDIGKEIIFGYGNETGGEYLKLEKSGDDFLENIKSTHYFSGTYYKDLEVFTNEPYEVYIYGLSCGPSDDVLLKTILQNPNCKQIRIFYRKRDDESNNYRNTLMNISRVFGENKEEMRSKIISIQENDFIPQHTQ